MMFLELRSGVATIPRLCQASSMSNPGIEGTLTRRRLALGLTAMAGPHTRQPGLLAQDVRSDIGGRLTVPVRIGEGPELRFAIDSAANASVIAVDLVERLGLTALPNANIHTLLGLETVSRVLSARLRTGAIDHPDISLVTASRGGLGGIDGLLGTDVLAGYRLIMEFAARRLRIVRSRSSSGGFFNQGRSIIEYRAPAEQRFVNLMMIDARSGPVACKAIIDTGARVSIINPALARMARASPITLEDGSRRQAVVSATGRSQTAEVMLLPTLSFGGITVKRVPVLMGLFHVFDLWGLGDRPAMLLGVDVLGLFRRVSIDLGRSELFLEI